MTEQECLNKMVAPGTRRPGKYREGVIQVHVTRACDKSCFNCTQGSQLAGPPRFISLDNFEKALLSLKGYYGVVGIFGGNPALHPQFKELCELVRKHVPANQRGIWCNNPVTLEKAQEMARTFDPSVSNLNVHLDQAAHDLFKRGWPVSHVIGLHQDSRHSPPWVAMKDVVRKPCKGCQYCNAHGIAWEDDVECDGSGTIPDESRIWELVSGCDINRHWSAMLGEFRGQLRAWFCEIAGAQAILHQDEPDYPDTGVPISVPSKERIEEASSVGIELMVGGVFSGHFPVSEPAIQPWWKLPMQSFNDQVRNYCFDCGIPLRGYGELAQAVEGTEQTSATHIGLYRPKRRGRQVQVVTSLEQLGVGKLSRVTDYIQNSKK